MNAMAIALVGAMSLSLVSTAGAEGHGGGHTTILPSGIEVGG